MFEKARFVECMSTFSITVITEDGTYYNVRPKENEANHHTIKKTIWKYKESDKIETEITTNQKYLLLHNLTTEKTCQVSIHEIYKTSESSIKDIESKKVRKAEAKKVQEFLHNELEIEIRSSEWHDDSADIQIFHKGKEIFYGKLESLSSGKPK